MEENIMSSGIKIKRENLGDQVSEHLKNRIINNEWAIGEKIPSENTLAAEFGVSRLTVRLAIQKLIALGILETKVGDGNYVKEFNYKWYMNEIADILIKPEMLDDVQEFRRIVETECAKLAMNNSTEEQLRELEKIALMLDSYEIDIEKGLDYNIKKHTNLDWNFHYKLCEASNNSLFILAYSVAKEPITRFLSQIFKSRWEKYLSTNEFSNNIIKKPIGYHMCLVKAIMEKDIEMFNQYASKMFNYKLTNYYDNFMRN
jgi:GntR family transcriptional repressor for pyruvate dehydrogenase complex